jgi:glyoxylase-like metal-dependent hydrolase (beta-lactamase superfamily II)
MRGIATKELTGLAQRVSGLGRRPEQLSESLFVYKDCCNVYIAIRSKSALLIDSGSGSVWSHLDDLGVDTVEWVLHTHHHRDQCLGSRDLPPAIRLAVPVAEADQLTNAEQYWQRRELYNLYDCSTSFDSPAESLRAARYLTPHERFEWQGLEFFVLPTPGHTRGSVTYVAVIDGKRVAFCGDAISAPDGRVDSLFDLQWDAVYPDALNVALRTATALQRVAPDILAPSHGEVIDEPGPALAGLETRLGAVQSAIAERFLGGGSDPTRPGTGTGRDVRFIEVSKHLIAVTHSRSHFYVIRDDHGHCLLFDYGFATEYHSRSLDYFVPHSLDELRERFGIEHIEVVVPTHYHHDHVAGIPFLQKHCDTAVWAHEVFASILAEPARFRLPALWHEPIAADRIIRDGETFTWRGLSFTSNHVPGHTWYQCVTTTEIDGVKVAFSGDALFKNGEGLLCGGAPMYRNRVNGGDFSSAVSTLRQLDPAVLLTGHSGAVRLEAHDLEAAAAWARRMENAWENAASAQRPVEFALDPDCVSIMPYLAKCTQGRSTAIEVRIRNHFYDAVDAWVSLTAPDGWRVFPQEIEMSIRGRDTGTATFEVEPARDAKTEWRHVLVSDVILGDRVLGGAAEGLVIVSDLQPDRPARGAGQVRA